MPLSSTDIAGLTGGFNQQVMLGMQHSAMMTQQFGGYAPNPMNQPVPTQGQNFSNLMTMAGGNQATQMLQSQGAQSFLGGMPAGFAQFGMSQMMYGAQQQNAMQTSMQQAYRHPNNLGGRGFTPTQLQTFGSDLRQMSMERGPGGEQTSFDELSRLATNMGRMGIARNVSSFQEFNSKFKDMIKTVKTIAEEMGTSLEEAQKMMVSLKGAGIFKHQDEVAKMLRQGALSGNISTAELSSSAMYGSQVARSIGGRGRAGALAGIEAMTRVGTAERVGVLNEEDIYNVTGLSGAEGRQAFTQNMLGMEARFWKSGLGRRALASVAGKGGRVNQEDVDAYMSGGVGTGETMGMAGKNLAKVGRADFIQNEGRLRGDAMRAFGGMGMATVARGWLEQRGMDPDSARGQLFLRRRFRLSQDEAESLGKMVQGLPLIQMQRQQSREQDEMEKSLETAGRKSSPTEALKRFEQARDKVNNKIRQMGADFNSQTANFLDNVLGKLTKNYERSVDKTLGPALAAVRSGTGDVDAILGEKMGLGPKASAADQGALDAYRKRAGLEGAEISQKQISSYVAANYDALKQGGYDPTNINSVEQIKRIQKDIRSKGGPELVGRLTAEGRFATREAEAFNRSDELYKGRRGSKAEDMNVLREPLEVAGLMMGGKSSKIGSALFGASNFLDENIFNPLGEKQTELLESGALRGLATMPRRGVAAGVGLLERGARGLFGDEAVTGAVGKDLSGQVNKALGGLLGDAEQRMGATMESWLGGTSMAQRKGLTEFMDSKEGKGMLASAMSKDEKVRKAARETRNKQIAELKSKKNITDSERGQLDALKSMGVMQAVNEMGGEPTSDEDWAKVAETAGVSVDEVKNLYGFAKQSRGEHIQAAREQYLETGTRAAGKEVAALEGQKESIAKLRKEGKLSEGTASYLDKMRSFQQRASKAASPEELAKIDRERKEYREKSLEGLSVAEKKQRAREMGLVGDITDSQRADMADMGQRAELETKFARDRRLGAGGGAWTAAKELGVSFSRSELRKMRGSPDEMVDTIMQRSGVAGLKDDEAKKDIRTKLQSISKMSDPAEQAKALAELKATRGGDFLKGKRDQQEKKAAEDDPSYRKLGELKTAIEAVTKAVNAASSNISAAVAEKVDEKGGKKAPGTGGHL